MFISARFKRGYTWHYVFITDNDANENKSQSQRIEFLTSKGILIYSAVLDFGLTFEHVTIAEDAMASSY